MQKIVFFLLLFVFHGSVLFSQRQFFIYMQADNNQPFYARINTRMYSSTENGYMIIPKLGDSTYNIVIGFPKNTFPEQNFPVQINNHDKGFQLKSAGSDGWQLRNLQNGSIIANTANITKEVSEIMGVKKTDAFSVMLANVVNDSAILYAVAKTPTPEKPAVTAAETKDQSTKDTASVDTTLAFNPTPVKKPDSSVSAPVTNNENTAKVTEAPPKAKEAAPPAVIPDSNNAVDAASTKKVTTEKPFITRIAENKSETSYQATYLEQYNFSTDTIKIMIPLAENSAATNPPPTATVVQQKTDSLKADPAVVEKKVVVEEKAPERIQPVVVDSAASAKKVLQVINSDCKDFATDYDIDKLRVKLISDKTIDDKLATARKYFKTKCLSVKQIKALTELFPSDETKYRFFDTSYPFVSDTSNFYMLEELIENNYYKNRFKAMIQKN